MCYCFTKSLSIPFSQAKEKIIESLKTEGFGIVTEIDMQTTLKKKLDVDFQKYEVLGACHPQYAYQALLAEDKVGAMLPCNIIIQQKNSESPVEVSAVDPVASLMAIKNEKLTPILFEVQKKLKKAIESL